MQVAGDENFHLNTLTTDPPANSKSDPPGKGNAMGF